MTYRNKFLGKVEKIVVKVGTSSITSDDGKLNIEFMKNVAYQISQLQKLNKQVIIVSSGSIGVGIEMLKLGYRPREIPIRQAAAAVGQSVLMQEWRKAFDDYDLDVAQILLSYDSFSSRLTYLNLRNSISTLLSYGVIPIINENDPTCVHEIEATFGDNDKLSAMVASKIEADLLIMLSDIDGLYDKNPKRNPDAKLLSTVEEITPEIESFGGNPSSTKGTGGMRTKIEAAKICNMTGCFMVIANSAIENVILKILDGEQIGTLFLTKEDVHKNRIRWIILSKSSGKIVVDHGAKNAIEKKMSLLPSGVVDVTGNFERGDIIEIECDGYLFAKGITDYSSDELDLIKGLHTDKIVEVLGYKNYNHVIKQENIGIIN
ncbi:glutamate 5-kinase [Methanosalsum natronophilum]|uniref:glutamate 5-kinase n=1 Tax=Methanosalsum natronophilum TaxID=768733 RepID=UPI0021672739|nr:glutamate 5-kinase [Methanosalsum natronophilum]MCS3923508.1 glutamate 5-kinase [Methanosalsum natronophilum]